MPDRKNRRRRGAKERKFTRRMQKKLVVIFMFIVVILVGLNIQITRINAESGERYTKQILDQQQYDSRTISYRRGDILDTNGTKLATSTKVYNVILDAKVVNDEEYYREPTIEALTECFDISREEIEEVLDETPDSQYHILKKQVSHEEAKTWYAWIETKTEEDNDQNLETEEKTGSNIKGVWLEDDYVREYPYDSLASHVVGFTVDGNLGNSGLENQYNSYLNGTDGREYGYWSDDAELERTTKAAVDGYSLITHLDVSIQRIVEEKIENYMVENADKYRTGAGASNISVLIMDPDTGAIMALANSGGYDLNDPRDLSAYYTEEEIENMSDDEMLEAWNAMWRNFAVSDTYEPGSTVKPLTVAAALETANAEEHYYCEGYLEVGDWEISCVSRKRGGHQDITLGGSLMESCNVAMMKMAAQMGTEDFTKYLDIFNMGKKTGVDLPGETAGIVYKEEDMDSATLATNSFGQNYNVNMLQVAAAFSSIVNGGYYYQPQVGKQLVDANGSVVENMEPVLLKQTVSRQTSNQIKGYLYDTVEEGTGDAAQIEGYKIGGKTGTAEKTGRDKTNYLVSFIGAVPIDDPELVIYVIIDEPNEQDQAHGRYATELAHDILTEVLEYLRIPMTEELSSSDDETDDEGETESADIPAESEDETEPDSESEATDDAEESALETPIPEVPLEDNGTEEE